MYGRCTGDVFGSSMHLLVVAYVGESFESQLKPLTLGEPVSSGVPMIAEKLKLES